MTLARRSENYVDMGNGRQILGIDDWYNRGLNAYKHGITRFERNGMLRINQPAKKDSSIDFLKDKKSHNTMNHFLRDRKGQNAMLHFLRDRKAVRNQLSHFLRDRKNIPNQESFSSRPTIHQYGYASKGN